MVSANSAGSRPHPIGDRRNQRTGRDGQATGDLGCHPRRRCCHRRPRHSGGDLGEPARQPHSFRRRRRRPPKPPPISPPPPCRMLPASARNGAQILTTVRNAIEAGRIDIYLQPIVTLPQRKVRFYEAMTRLRDDKDQVLTADDFIATAETAGLMARIDHTVMLRCMQVLRRLMVRNKDVGRVLQRRRRNAEQRGNLRAMPRLSRRQSRAGLLVRARIQAEHVSHAGAGRERASGGTGVARLPLLDRPRHRSADRAARTGRSRRSLHQGACRAAARCRSRPRHPIFTPPTCPICSAASASI